MIWFVFFLDVKQNNMRNNRHSIWKKNHSFIRYLSLFCAIKMGKIGSGAYQHRKRKQESPYAKSCPLCSKYKKLLQQRNDWFAVINNAINHITIALDLFPVNKCAFKIVRSSMPWKMWRNLMRLKIEFYAIGYGFLV